MTSTTTQVSSGTKQSDPARQKQVRAALLMIVGVLLFGSWAPVMARLAQEEGMPTTVIVLLRLIIGAVFLSGVVLQQGGPKLPPLSRRLQGLIVLAGMFLTLHFLGLYTALEHTTVLVTSMLLATSPLMVMVWEIVFLRIKHSRVIGYSLILTIIGALIITLGKTEAGLGEDPLLGGAFGLVGALGISAYMFLGRVIRPHIKTVPYVWLVYTVSAITASIIVAAQGVQVTGYSFMAYFWVVTLTVLAQIYAQSAINYALGVFSATYVSVALRGVNVMAAVYAIFVFDEVPGIWQVVGSAIILSGVFLTVRSRASED